MSACKLVVALACALLLGAASPAHAQANGDSLEVLPASLVEWSASDFAAHGPRPEKVRNVHVRYAERDSGGRTYMLCGQLLPAKRAKPTWVQFATVKTDPYEQWIGGQAESLCERALPLPGRVADLSSMLQARLNRAPEPVKQP